jgi:hypothetical protein
LTADHASPVLESLSSLLGVRPSVVLSVHSSPGAALTTRCSVTTSGCSATAARTQHVCVLCVNSYVCVHVTVQAMCVAELRRFGKNVGSPATYDILTVRLTDKHFQFAHLSIERLHPLSELHLAARTPHLECAAAPRSHCLRRVLRHQWHIFRRSVHAATVCVAASRPPCVNLQVHVARLAASLAHLH